MSYDNRTRHAWFRCLDGCGEEAVDLFVCRRFALSWFDQETHEGRTVVYFMFPADGHPPRWIKLTGFTDWDDELKREVYLESFEEVEPQEAANDFLWAHRYRGGLPKELEPFRQFGDYKLYCAWLNSDERDYEGGDSEIKNGRIPRRTLEEQDAEACKILLEHRDWNLTQIAKEMNISRTRLYKLDRLMKAKALLDQDRERYARDSTEPDWEEM